MQLKNEDEIEYNHEALHQSETGLQFTESVPTGQIPSITDGVEVGEEATKKNKEELGKRKFQMMIDLLIADLKPY